MKDLPLDHNSRDSKIGDASRILATIMVGAVATVLTSARTTPFVLATLAAAVGLVVFRERKSPKISFFEDQAFCGLSALTGYMTLTAFWAPDGLDALTKGISAFLILLAAAFVAHWMSRQADQRLGILAFWFMLTFSICALFLLVEFLSDLEIRRQLLNALGIHPRHSYYRLGADGRISSISPNALAHSITMLALLLWPAVLCCRLVLAGKVGQIACILMVAVTTVAILLSRSDSAKLAVIGSILLFALASWRTVVATRLLTVGWVLAVLAMLPLALMAFENRLYHADWIPKSAQDRIVIWGHTAHETLKSPVLGHGVHAAYNLYRKEMKSAIEPPGGHRQVMTVSSHAHNVYLQVWFEVGAIGIALFVISGLLLLRRSERMESLPAIHTLATFATFMVIIFSTWGAFQYWFMSAFSLTALALYLGARLSEVPAPEKWSIYALDIARHDVTQLASMLRRRSSN